MLARFRVYRTPVLTRFNYCAINYNVVINYNGLAIILSKNHFNLKS
jgi:hypothetical protein